MGISKRLDAERLGEIDDVGRADLFEHFCAAALSLFASASRSRSLYSVASGRRRAAASSSDLWRCG